MLQRLFAGWIIFLTLVVGYLLWQQRQQLVYVDSAKLLNEYQAMLIARKDYAAKAQKWQANVDTLSADVQRAIREHEHKLAGMSFKERELSTQLLHKKQQELVSYQRAVQESAQQEEQKGTQQVLTRVNTFLTHYGQTHGYALILIATPAGAIGYARPGLDVTDEVVQELNKDYGKPAQ